MIVSVLFAITVLSAASNGSPVPEKRHSPPPGYHVPAYYPAPYGGWVDEWKESYGKAKKLVDSMTLAEKVNITSGTGIFMGIRCNGNTGSALRVGIPQLCLEDAANGIRQADHVTVFPDGITTGSTFDKELMYQRGVAIGKEAQGKGVNIWLGPTVGPIGRKPKGGRNWEGFGADPVLQAVGAHQTIKGVQEQDDRTLHEVYLWPFAEGVRAGVGAAMAAYNAVNGTACSQHPYLLNGILKDELGFQGLAMSDWLGHMSGVESAIAGLDLNMPGDTQVPLFGFSYWMYEMTRSVLNGSVPMVRLNDMTTRVVASWYKMGQDQDFPATNFHYNTRDENGAFFPAAFPLSPHGVVNENIDVREHHDEIARQVAQDGITMLKNEDCLLPLSSSRPIKVFGTDAQKNPKPNACPDRNCNKGTLGQGWGSGTVDYVELDDPIGALRARAGDVTLYAQDSLPLFLPKPLDEDVAIVFISSDAGENTYTVEGNHGDRDASGLYAWHNGDKLVQDVAAKYNNVIVVAHTVGPLVLEKWIDLPSIKSVLIAHLPGQEAGRSLVEVLYGDVSPSGHLPYSITSAEDDLPTSVTDLIDFAILYQPDDTYTESFYTDYRYLNKQGTRPRYAFGHGLSYTNFTYTNASIKKVTQLTRTPPLRKPKSGILDYTQDIPAASEAVKPDGFSKIPRYLYSWLSKVDAEKAAKEADERKYPYPDGYSTMQKPGPRAGGGLGGNPALWDVAYEISVTVTNTGSKFAGKASAQAYLQFPEDIAYETPIIQLRDFEKTKSLEPGSSQTVTLKLTRKDVSVWDTVLQDWVVPEVDGAYNVWLGEASDDLGTVCHVDTLKCETGVRGPA